MAQYNPDRWVVIKIGDSLKFHLRVFAVWYGGYTTGDSWKLNSGITKIEEDGDSYLFYGESGSVYKCHKSGYGTSAYGHSVLSNMIDNPLNVTVTIFPEDTDWNALALA